MGQTGNDLRHHSGLWPDARGRPTILRVSIPGARPVALVVAGGAIVVAKVALSAPQLADRQAWVAITWLVVTSFVVVGVALLATDLPAANGWACLLVAAATIPGDVNDVHYQDGYVTSVGYVLEPLYLPAAVALVLRYPRSRLTYSERWLVWGLAACSTGFRACVVITSGALPDGFYRPSQWPAIPVTAWWHDWVFLRVGHTATVVMLVFTAAMLITRLLRSAGMTRQSLAPLVVIGATCAVAAAIDQLIWVLNVNSLHWVPAALIRDLSAAAIPVALIADLLRRRAATAAVAERVLAASRSGDLPRLQAALRDVMVDPTLMVSDIHPVDRIMNSATTAGDRPSSSGRRIETVTSDDHSPLFTISFDSNAVQDEALLRTAMNAVRLGAENNRLHADLIAQMSELQESRARIVEAGISERRRVERNLHDGAQQQFLAVAATLARADLVNDGQIRDIVDDARTRLVVALRELRQLARGIHPAALSQGGLPAALPGLCYDLPFDVDLSVDQDLSTQRPPPAPETAAYFLVAEALANAVRHGRPNKVTVTVNRTSTDLLVRICDDGAGGARIVPHGGLAGLADRVEALGGKLTVHGTPCPHHPTPTGATLEALLPVDLP